MEMVKIYIKELHEDGVEIVFKRDSANCFVEMDGEHYQVSVDGEYISDMTYEKMFIKTDKPSTVDVTKLQPVEEHLLKMLGMEVE